MAESAAPDERSEFPEVGERVFVCVARVDEQHVVNLPGIPPFGKAGGLYPFLRNGKLREVDAVHTPARFPCRRAQRKGAFARVDAGRVSPMHWCSMDGWHPRRLDKESTDFRFPGMVEI